MRNITLCFTAIALTACATIIDGESQEIQLQSAQNKRCLLENERGSWHSNAQGLATVKRSQSRLNITCNDYAGNVKLDDRATMNPWFLGNVLIGGLIGVVVDPLTGAMFKYADTIALPSNVAARTPAQPSPQPIQQVPRPQQLVPARQGQVLPLQPVR